MLGFILFSPTYGIVILQDILSFLWRMIMKTIKMLLTALMAFGFVTLSQTVSADGWPFRIVGNWAVNADNFVGTLQITAQATTGKCQSIAGFIFENPIQGFYCPGSGRVHFFRKNPVNNDTFQVYSANLSQTFVPPGLRMGGLFSDLGQPGEYSFFASKP